MSNPKVWRFQFFFVLFCFVFGLVYTKRCLRIFVDFFPFHKLNYIKRSKKEIKASKI